MSREKTHKIKRTLTLSQDYWRDELAALELFWKNRPYGSFQFVTRKVLWRINCTKFTIKWWQISKHTWKTTGGLLMPCRFPLFVFPFAYLPLSQKQLRNRLINRRQRWVNNSMHTNQPHSFLENFLWNPLGVSGALQSLYRCPSSMGISYKDLSSSFSSSTSLKKGGGGGGDIRISIHLYQRTEMRFYCSGDLLHSSAINFVYVLCIVACSWPNFSH